MNNTCDFTSLVRRIERRLNHGQTVSEIVADMSGLATAEALRFAIQAAEMLRDMPGPDSVEWQLTAGSRCHIVHLADDGHTFTTNYSHAVSGEI